MANIELDGSNKKIIVDSGDLTLDIPGDIILDADGANVTFKDGGTAILDISNSSSDAVITSSVQDKDIIFKGDDGGSAITALTLDMSAAGAATFNGAVTAGGILKTDDTTEATSTTDGSLQTDGGLSVAKDTVMGDDLKLLSDASVIHFGANSEVTLTHSHDAGLNLKHTATADDKPIVLTLQTGETDIAASDVLGAINFQAPDEGTGTDAILVAAGIEAVSEGDFSSSNNATKLSFKTAASEAAAEKMSLSSEGVLTTSGDIVAASGSVRNRPNAQPIIINGDCALAQRATSATGKTASGYYTCDRWHLNLYNLGTWTIAQEALSSGNAYDNGFRTAFRIDCTTADASPSASDSAYFRQKLEAQNVQMFKKGTSNAEKYTLAFWVKSNKTGTNIFTCGLYDHDNTRSVFQNYSISSADTWEHKVLNFPADTSGVIANDNAVGMDVRWYLGAGSDYTGGTQATSAWESQTAANNLPSGKVNLADNTANDIAITGVQLEVGEFSSTTLPPYQHESYGDNLARCQRYFQLPQNWWAYSDSSTATAWKCFHDFPVIMRAAPTLGTTGTPTVNKMNANAAGPNSISSTGDANVGGFQLSFTTMATGTGSSAATNTPYQAYGGFTASAEL